MKKHVIFSLAALFIMSGFNICYADTAPVTDEPFTPVECGDNMPPMGPPPGDRQGPPPHFRGTDGHGPKHFDNRHPSRAEMDKKRAEIDKRLKLTDKQKKQIELQKQQDREKIKPVLDSMRAKKQEFRAIQEDNTLSQEDKDKKLKEVKDSLKELKQQADTLRKENMQNFENVLTDKQKKEFAKIKEEQKKEMELRKKQFDKKRPFPKPLDETAQ